MMRHELLLIVFEPKLAVRGQHLIVWSGSLSFSANISPMVSAYSRFSFLCARCSRSSSLKACIAAVDKVQVPFRKSAREGGFLEGRGPAREGN
jgi:hypothetical protein